MFDPSLFSALEERLPAWRAAWETARPFRWVMMEDFLPRAFAESLVEAFPNAGSEGWDRSVYTHQRNKLTMTRGLPAPHADFFDLTADPRFLDFVSRLTGLTGLLADPDLLGGGLHQSVPGAFLDVHVDYNLHPSRRWHRRLNLLLYLNRGWRAEYEGYLELWDMTGKRRLQEIAPLFNRAVLFETNDISFHGHPHPLACPPGETRKSLAVYYFTETRDDGRATDESNTQYRQTTGLSGYAKTMRAGVAATRQRLRSDGVFQTARRVTEKIARRLMRLPPKNG
jgi:hypothetical protein